MSDESAIKIGDWTLVPSAGEIRRDGKTIHLEPRLIDVLHALAEKPGEVVSVEQLLDGVWGDRYVTPESVYQAVSKLRKSLEDRPGDPGYIETLPKRGYRLTVPVSVVRSRDDSRWPMDGAPWQGAGSGIGKWPVALIEVGLLVIAVVTLPRFLPIGPEPVSSPASVAVVAADRATGRLADRLVTELLSSDAIRLVTPTLPVSAGRSVEEQVLLDRAVSADVVVSLYRDSEDEIIVSILDLVSGSTPERQLITADADDPSGTVSHTLDRIWAILGESPATESNQPAPWPSISRAARFEALARYHMQRRFAANEVPEAALDRAENAFRNAIDTNQDFVPAWTGLAMSQVLQAQYLPEPDRAAQIAVARTTIDRAFALAPETAEAYAALGLAAAFSGDLLEARALMERALNLDPADPALMRWLASFNVRQGYYRQAAALALRAAELAPYSLELLNTAVLNSALAGEFDASIRLAGQALALDPGNASAMNNLMVAYRETGRLDSAIVVGKQLLGTLQSSDQLAASFLWVPGMVSDLYIDIGDPAAAQAILDDHGGPAHASVTETLRSQVKLALARGDIESARRQIAHWNRISETRTGRAEVATRALMIGMEELGRQLIESLPDPEGPPEGANPMLSEGRLLRREYLPFASLPAVYSAMLHVRAGDVETVRHLLDESVAFLDYWIGQGVDVSHCLYLRAAVHAMRGETTAGITSLSEAVETGWRDAWRIANDPLFNPLRQDPEFPTILASLQALLTAQRENIAAKSAQRILSAESQAEETSRARTDQPPPPPSEPRPGVAGTTG